MIKKSDRNTTRGWALLALMVVIYTAMSVLTPWQLDEYLFASIYRDYAGGFHPDPSAYAQYFTDLRNNDNARLSNELLPPILLWPGTTWVLHVLTGLAVGGIVWMVDRIAIGSWRPRPALILATWALMLLALPWRNSLFVADYTLNYLFSAVIMLAWALAMIRLLQRGLSTGGYVGTILLGFLAAGWHESFIAPLVAGLAAASLMWPRGKHFSAYWMMLAMVAVVMLAFALSPGMIVRANREISGVDTPKSMLMVLINTWLVAVTVAAALAALLTAKGRHILQCAFADRWIVLLLVTTIAGTIISMMVKTSARTSFWPQLTMMIAWLRLAYIRRWRWRSPVSAVAAGVVFALILIQSGLSLYWQYLYKKEHDEIIKRIEAGETTVYYDFIQPEEVPLATLYMPARLEFNDRFPKACLKEYYHNQELAVVPTAVEGDITTGRKVGDGIYEYNGEIVADISLDACDYDSAVATVTATDGTEKQIIYDGTCYRDRNGNMHVWLKARTSLLGRTPIQPTNVVKIVIND